MNIDEIKDINSVYERPAMETIDIQTEGSILQTSGVNDPEFDIVPGQTGAWD